MLNYRIRSLENTVRSSLVCRSRSTGVDSGRS